MDKSYQSISTHSNTTTSGDANTTTTHSRYQNLRQLNKLSQKINKPIFKKPTFVNYSQNQQQNYAFNNQNRPQVQAQLQHQHTQSQNQPPVYNISKNDFRDVVQKLTGSPAHERILSPPPIQQTKPQSSRLQRIRPPPLAQISNRPPPMQNGAVHFPQPPTINASSAFPSNSINTVSINGTFSGFGKPVAPLSPLPPFPTVHAAAETPISAYFRRLQNSIDSNSKQFPGFSPLAPLVSPRLNNFASQQSQPEQQLQQGMLPSETSSLAQSQSQFQMPSSPAPFGCLNSPISYYPLFSPSLLFSPSSGQLRFPQLPLSPTVPVPSPNWRGL